VIIVEGAILVSDASLERASEDAPTPPFSQGNLSLTWRSVVDESSEVLCDPHFVV